MLEYIITRPSIEKYTVGSRSSGDGITTEYRWSLDRETVE